jgi:type I restriction enzyme S subunit
MMISLNPKGRCAVIVPDGVLFNDAKLHHDTRKYLIEKMNLKKVISLEGNFFMNTGVKSSILYFVNDGTTQEVEFSKIKLVNGDIIEENIKKVKKDILVAKDYTLFINKYIESVVKKIEGIEYKKLGDMCEFLPTTKHTSSIGKDVGLYRFYNSSQDNKLYLDTYEISNKSIIIGNGGNFCIHLDNNFTASKHVSVLQVINISLYNISYIYYYLLKNIEILKEKSAGATISWLNRTNISDIEIPIPSLDIQKQIVEILDNDYNIIKTNKDLIKMYEARKKNIIWSNTISQKTINLVELADFKSGKYNSSDAKEEGLYPFYNSEAKNPVGFSDNYCFDYENYIILIKDGGAGQGKYGNQIGLGKVFLVNGKSSATSHQLAIIPKTQNNTKFIYYYLQYIKNKIMDLANYTTGLGTIRKSEIEDIKIPIPTSEIQKQIVSQCEQIDSFIANLEKEIQTIESSNIINIILKSITATTTATTTNTNSSSNNETNETNEITGQPNQLVNPEVTSEDVSSKPIKKKVLSKPIVKKTSTPVQEVIINE